MRIISVVLSTALALAPLSARAQCFNRGLCGDPSTMEIRSQINVNVLVDDQASAADSIKAMESVRKDLYALSNRECDTLKTIFGGECTLTSVNINSSIQDRGSRSKSANISISNTYMLKKPPK